MTFLGPLLIALIIGGIFFCTILALAACMRSGQLSKAEDKRRAQP